MVPCERSHRTPRNAKDCSGPAHSVRNRGEYEGNLQISERLVTDMVASAKRVLSALERLR
jgi:hypothetical protein